MMRPLRRPLLDQQTQVLGTIWPGAGNSSRGSRLRRIAWAPQPIRARLQVHMAWLEQEVTRTEMDLAQAILDSPMWSKKRIACGARPAWGRCRRPRCSPISRNS